MDREQEEMQFIGLFGIFRESIKVIISWRKIFSQITLTLILPLTFIFLAHMEVSHLLFSNIRRTEFQRDISRPGSRTYDHLSQDISSEWINYFLFKAAYFTFLLIFSLLSTAAVVYTIASIYTARDVTFKKVMTVVPRVWKRLMVTFLCMFLAFFIYNVIAFLIFILWAVTTGGSVVGVVLFILILILYAVGFVYMTIVWQLASVVSVLESSYGIKAMTKAMKLIKGQRILAIVIFFMLNLSLVGIEILFEILVVHGRSLEIWKRVGFGILCFLLLFKLFLFGLVIQTILYLVCKSYHHENIDKLSLSDHLESYLGDYEPLTNKDVQLEQYHV